MRLIRHINEESLEMITKILSSQCKPILKEIQSLIKTNKPFWFLQRGMRNKSSHFFKMSVRSNRNPSDSSVEWQTALDNAFYDKFKVKPRSSGVFCKLGSVESYGKAFKIFPTGNNYKFCYSKSIEDLYSAEPSDNFDDVAKNIVKSYKLDHYLRDVVDNLQSRQYNEIMVLCDEYYALSINEEDPFLDWIENETY